MLRVDLATREIWASVRDIAQATGYRGPTDGPLGAARAMLGSDVHRRYRRQREDATVGFRAEVAASTDVRVDDFVLHLRGRIDGVIHEPGGRLLVEEVKSVARAGAAFAALRPDHLPEAALQLRLYAWLLARERTPARLAARLVLVSVFDGAARDIDVTLRPVRTEQALVRRVRRVVATATARARRARRARDPAARLAFPYAAPRPHQREMSAFVGRCLDAARPALIEAPTGIGKTVAALVPALDFAQRRAALLYVLTAKRTQRARIAETFEDVVSASGPRARTLRALTLRPRSAMCPPGTLLCQPRYCRHLAGLGRKEAREDALAALLSGPAHIDPQRVFELGAERVLCPHVLALLLCARVDLVIGDYNHVYAAAEAPGRFPGESLPRPAVVLLDEAHNLFDRARAYDSPFLARRDVTALLARQEARARTPSEPLFDFARDEAPRSTLDARLERHLRAVLARIDATLEDAAGPDFPDGCRPAGMRAEDWTPLARAGAQMLVPHVQRLAARGDAVLDDPLVQILDRIGRIRDLLARDDPALVPYASCADAAARGLGVGICCVDPSARLAARHREVLGTVAMSATLTPLEHYAGVLGLEALDPGTVAYGSPFPVEQRCVAVVPTVQTTWRARARHYARIARLIERTVAVKPGHYVAYFPSFAFLEAVRARLSEDVGAVVAQTPRMTDASRAEVLTRLVEDPAPLLVLAVSGGVFAEGIDLPGDALIGVVVVGPALPRVGFERAAMAQHFEESRGGGFARAMLLPGMQRVVQAAGRVHRTPEDRGVIVLLGRRFAQPPYVEYLPEHWSRYGVEETLTDDPVARLSAFWHGP